MCVSCGCAKPNDNHGDQRNITLQDLDAAAQAASTTRERVIQHISDSIKGSTSSGHLRDGYKDTEGSQYDSLQAAHEQSDTSGQEEYDPTHSGVRHAQNKPGQHVATPGRETGTAWTEQQQMGYTTDTPDRRNPAN